MKRGLNIIIAISIILCISMIKPPQKVLAKDTKVAEGVWNTGIEVEVDATIPASLNLLTKGVKITKPGLICHPFQGGQFHWVGEIRQLKDGQWVKLPTVSDWVPSTEGVFTACAQAAAAGTYALFGYYNGPLEIFNETLSGNPVDCSTVNWHVALISLSAEPERLYYMGHFFSIPIGTPVIYRVTNMVPDNIYGGALTGSFIVGENGFFTNFERDNSFIRLFSAEDPNFTVDFSVLNCTFTKIFPFHI